MIEEVEVERPRRVKYRILVAVRVQTRKLCLGMAGFDVHLQGDSEQKLLLTLAALLLACVLYHRDGSHSRRNLLGCRTSPCMLFALRPAAEGPPALLESANVVDQSQVLMDYDLCTIEEIESLIFSVMIRDYTLIIVRVLRDIEWVFWDIIVTLELVLVVEAQVLVVGEVILVLGNVLVVRGAKDLLVREVLLILGRF